MCENYEADNSFWEHIQKMTGIVTVFFFLKLFLFSYFALFCFTAGTCCYHAQQGMSDDKIGERGLLFRAANHSTLFHEVVTVDAAIVFLY